jgi:hypothetical protein
LLPSFSSQNWQQGGSCVSANRSLHVLRARTAGIRGTGLDLAGQRSRSPFVLVRPSASVRSGTAPWRRPGRSLGRGCRRPDGGRRVVRGHRAWWRQDRVDRDALGLHGDARPPRLDRCRARGADEGRGRRRHRRAERGRRPSRAVRLFRRSCDRAGSGLSRSADVPAPACRTQPARTAAGERASRRADCAAGNDGTLRAGAGGRSLYDTAAGSGRPGRGVAAGLRRRGARRGRGRRGAHDRADGPRAARGPCCGDLHCTPRRSGECRGRLGPQVAARAGPRSVAAFAADLRGRRAAPRSPCRVGPASHGAVAGDRRAGAARCVRLPLARAKAGRRPTYHGWR